MELTTLGQKSIGSVVKLKENGVYENYLVVQQGTPSSQYDASCDGTWVLRESSVEKMGWGAPGVTNYALSLVHNYCTTTFLNRLDPAIVAVAREAKLPYQLGSGGAVLYGSEGLPCKAFLPSICEIGVDERSGVWFVREGACMSHFAETLGLSGHAKRITLLNGSAFNWWVRTPVFETNGTSKPRLWAVDHAGLTYGATQGGVFGVRPAMVLPKDLIVLESGIVTGEATPPPPPPQLQAGLLGNQSPGVIVKIKMSGGMREFVVMHQGCPSALYDQSCDGTWLLMKDLHEARPWHTSNLNDYANSEVHSYLNSTLLGLFDAPIRGVVKEVKIPYRAGSGGSKVVSSGVDGLSCKVFLPSNIELGAEASWSYMIADGAKLGGCLLGSSAEANAARIARLSGAAEIWYTRTPRVMNATSVWGVNTEGKCSYSYSATTACGVRPMVVLPKDLTVMEDGTLLVNQPPSEPGQIHAQEPVCGGDMLTLSWETSSDVDDNLVGYRLERRVDQGNWVQVYQGPQCTFVDSITRGWNTVVYRVRAYDEQNAVSGYSTSATFSIINNSAPTAPPSFQVPALPLGGQNLGVSWGTSTDVDGNLAGYKLERQVDGGDWTSVYTGVERAFEDQIIRGWKTVSYRVSAFDDLGAFSGFTGPQSRAVVNNCAPMLSGTDAALGVKCEPFSQAYAVQDPDGDGVTLTELLDGVVLRTVSAEADAGYTAEVDAPHWQRLLNGTHTLTVRAVDDYAGGSMQSERVWSFEKREHTLSVMPLAPLAAEVMPTRCVISVGRELPFGAIFKAEVCNNGFDTEPVWEDCTAQVVGGRKFGFTNTSKTAERWGFNVRVSVERGDSVGDCYITGIGGNFE